MDYLYKSPSEVKNNLTSLRSHSKMGNQYKQRNLKSEIKMGYNQDFKIPVDQRTTRHVFHDQDFQKLTTGQSQVLSRAQADEFVRAAYNQSVENINIKSKESIINRNSYLEKSSSSLDQNRQMTKDLNIIFRNSTIADGKPYPLHAERRNMRNESSVSLKQDSDNYKQEQEQKKKLINWAKQKNKIYTLGPKSYVKYPELPNPPRIPILNQSKDYSSRLVTLTTQQLQQHHIDIAQIRAQAIINKEEQCKHIATDFQRARTLIKSKNRKEIEGKQQASIQTSKYNKSDQYFYNSVVEGKDMDMMNNQLKPSVTWYKDSKDRNRNFNKNNSTLLSQSLQNFNPQNNSQVLLSGQYLNDDRLEKFKIQQKGKKANFKIGEYSLKIGSNRYIESEKNRYRTTFQLDYYNKKIEKEQQARANSASQTRNVSVPMLKSENSKDIFQSSSKRDYPDFLNRSSDNVLNQSTTSLNSENNRQVYQQYSIPGRISIDKMIQNQNLKPEFNTIYSHQHHRQGLTPTILKHLKDDNYLNKSLKKDITNSHFQLGGKTLVSADLNSPMHLLDSEKQQTVFKPKPISNEENVLRSKFKEKIERQNWNIKQQISLDEHNQIFQDNNRSRQDISKTDMSRMNSTSNDLRNGYGFANSNNNTGVVRSNSHFNLGYMRSNEETKNQNANISRDRMSSSSLGFQVYITNKNNLDIQNNTGRGISTESGPRIKKAIDSNKFRDSLSQLRENQKINQNNQNRRSNVNLGDNKKVQYSSNYREQYPWQIPKYDYL